MRASDIYPAGRLYLREIGLRDGLQTAKRFPDTATKIAWIDAEHAAGIRHFEVGSFLPEKSFPQFADLADIVAHVRSLNKSHGAAQVFNERSVAEALASGVPELRCTISASEAHSRRYTHRTIAEAIDTVRIACRMREDKVHRPVVSVEIAMAFGCTIAGPADPAEVLAIAERCFEAGANMISLADSIGFAGPHEVGRLVGETCRIAGERPVGVHLQDTRGLGIVNASAAIDHGAIVVDAALGGLGGSPTAPGAPGNIVLEDLAFLCEKRGFKTGIDLGLLIAAREAVAAAMPGEPLRGALARVGLPVFETASRRQPEEA